MTSPRVLRSGIVIATVLVGSVAMVGTAGGARDTGRDGVGGGDAGQDRRPQIVVTEQETDRILVLESDPDAWSRADVVWQWRPSEDNGLGEFVENWGLPDEAKLRYLDDRAYLLTTDSYGLAAVIPYPEGSPAYWATDAGRPNNPHSIELLPDGNVAVAASTGGFVRVYTASQGPRSSSYVEFDLPGGHGVYWDAANEVLWALGDHDLVALSVGGTPADPTLTETHRAALPTPWGHDLQPVAGDPDRLWVTSGSAVYQYSIAEDEFDSDYPAADLISRSAVKSVDNDPGSGQVLSTAAQAGHTCGWCTDTVDLHGPDDQAHEQLTLDDVSIYKARWWADPNRPAIGL